MFVQVVVEHAQQLQNSLFPEKKNNRQIHQLKTNVDSKENNLKKAIPSGISKTSIVYHQIRVDLSVVTYQAV